MSEQNDAGVPACFLLYSGKGGVGVFDSTCFCVAAVAGGVRVRVMLEVNAQSMHRCVHHCGSGRMGRRQYGVLLCCVQVVRNGPCHTAAWGEEKGRHMPHAPQKKGRHVMRGGVLLRCAQMSWMEVDSTD